MNDNNTRPRNEVEREPDPVYALMMDALDGELTASRQAELAAHLRARPDLAREWQAWQAVDHLFRSTPALAPAADFTQRTLALLPDPRQRLWVLAGLYASLLIIGLVPIIFLIWIAVAIAPLVAQPAILRSLGQFLGQALRLTQVVVEAILVGAGQFIGERPVVLVWFVAMGGAVALWGGVYRQLTSPLLQRNGSTVSSGP